MALKDAFVWGAGGSQLTPDQIARQRAVAAALIKNGIDYSPVQSWTQGAARVSQGILGALEDRQADNSEKANLASDKAMQASLIPFLTGTGGGGAIAGPSADAAAPTGTPIASAGAIPPGDPNAIQSQFIDTVKNGYDAGNGQKLAVTNPYGLAAIAATGQAESGYDPKNAGGTWADGANPAGGIMSWNGPRLSNLQKFAGGGNGTPEQQGQFFLQENPGLIAGLNNAKSVDEAQHLMNNAWAFKGYDQPGNPNAAHRLALANGYLPKFQGQSTGGAQVASLDPSSGMGSMPPSGAGQLPAGGAIPIPQPRPEMQPQGALDPATASPTQMMSALGIQPDPSVDTRVAAAGPQAAPPLAPPVNIPSQPISNPQQVAQAAPIAPPQPPSASAAPSGVSPAVIAALTSPTASPATRQLAGAIIQQAQQRQQAAVQFQYDQKKALYEQQLKQADPIYQQTLAKAKYENDHLGQVSPDTQATLAAQDAKAKADAQNALTLADHNQALKAGDPLEQANVAKINSDTANANVTPDIKEFNFATQNGYTGSFADWQISNKKAGATTNNIDTGEGNKFYNTLDEKNAAVFSGLSDTGIQSRSKLAQINQLDKLLQASPTGAMAVLKQKAGDWGVNTDGLSDIQAANALLSQMIPQQRPPGSGPVSDADLAGFRNSLPRLINQPGGNATIINTMRGLTQYQIDMGTIADQVANREISPSEGREKIANLVNPLANFSAPPPGKEGDGWQDFGNGVRVRKVK